MNKKIYILFTILIITSCGLHTPSSIKKSFTYCYDGKLTGLDTMLNLNGFFYIKNTLNDKIRLETKNSGYFHPCFIFYNMGFAHDNAWLMADKERNKVNEYFDNRFGARFGRYVLCHDTIKLQYVSSPGGMMQGIAEVWFKVLDREHIRLLYWGDPGLVTNEKVKEYIENGHYRNAIFNFYPIKHKIEPEKTWIYHKRWFKCREK